MKIGILTLPLHNNYGGILQAAALYHHLGGIGHTPVLLSKKLFRPRHQRLVGQFLRAIPGQDIRGIRTIERQRSRHYDFIERFIPKRSKPLYSVADVESFAAQAGLDAIIVGSDQVWRSDYVGTEDSGVYFLNFGSRFRKIAYAASFGKSEWTRKERIPDVRRMLAAFDYVSIREVSGVELCRTTLGRHDCRLAIDPTLLVDPTFFCEAMAPSQETTDYTLNYALDPSTAMRSVVDRTLERTSSGREVRKITLDDGGNTVDIPSWLRAFHDATAVVTDSFHGTIFSILFRKPFVCVGNSERGVDRFVSLLSLLGLQDRLVLDASNRGHVDDPIDFDLVYSKLDELRQDSNAFLSQALRQG